VLYLGRLVSTGPVTDYDTATAVHWMTTGDGSSRSEGRHRRTLSEELS